MFTRCPECQLSQPLTVAQLRSGRGMVRCRRCGRLFDALAALTEQDEVVDTDPPRSWLAVVKAKLKPFARALKKGSLDLTAPPPPAPVSAFWSMGVVLAVLALLGQWLYFEGYGYTQNPVFRPRLEKLCAALQCRLPDYKNVQELTVLHHALERLQNHHYNFRIVLLNEAAVSLHYPKIGLTLLTYQGQPFAHRVFAPADYLTGLPETGMIAPDAVLDIGLKIAAPETPIGGFNFDLSY